MKKIFILCVFAFAAIFSKAQVVLNEVYPEPGATHQEFFELYNTSTNPVPESLDNYTLIAYYEEPGGKSGFYVLDLPNQTVNAKGYYGGSSLSTFAIQGKSGLSADLNWNSIPAGGALTKWEKSGSSYTSVSVPANLNDLFVKITGGGGGSAAFEVFVYKNGILVNGIMGGSNANAIPSSLKAMPDLFVDMTGSSPDFTIKFSTISDNSVEYISGTAGTNNGYYRQYDGKCGVWKLSSSAADYTPGQSNGSAAATLGTLTISASISSYVADPTKSLLTYNITAGPADAFPVVVEVYQDLGIIGELDASDVLVDSKNIGSSATGSQNYMYYETTSGTDKVMYRLKMTDKNHEADYSRILIFQLKSAITNNIKIIGNPVNDKLTFSYTASATQVVDVKVYDMTGRMVLKSKVNSLKGSNVISLPLNSTFKAGMYVVEVNNGTELQSSKFVKQ